MNQLHWVNIKKRRFYRVYLQIDLFGGTSIVRCWGSLDSKNGNYCINTVDTADDIEKQFNAIDCIRKQRGYDLIT
jgi:predicted DNA-binding WGR domain protein